MVPKFVKNEAINKIWNGTSGKGNGIGLFHYFLKKFLMLNDLIRIKTSKIIEI